MNTLTFSITIDAPRATVWTLMLSHEGYRTWAAAFMEGCCFEGTWEAGGRIRFLAPGGSGITSVIAENRLHEHLSIKHLGTIQDGVEDTESEEVRSWTPAFETYAFLDRDGGCELRVALDCASEYEAQMREAWPKALALLKALCETPQG